MESVNPHNGQVLHRYQAHTPEEIAGLLETAERTFCSWRETTFAERGRRMRKAAEVLRARQQELALLMAREMGKVLRDGVAEVEKCAACCEFYASNAERFLSIQEVSSDAQRSYVAFDPLGLVLAIMPWNFPLWQVFRFAAPALMAGNVGVLKHASNVSGCALAIEEIFKTAGLPKGAFTTLLVPGSQVETVIRHPLVKAVTLTGSTPAGRAVASAAGSELKKTVLELGGSDAYLVLDDAELELAVETCVKSRLINAGQSCIAAKRFIVVRALMPSFERLYVERFKAIRYGDPSVEGADIGPLARRDLREEVHRQVERSVAQGARLLLGGVIPEGPGAYYPPTVLGGVRPGMVAFDEEIFGPVAALIEAADEAEALRLANQSPFGLGAALFTRDAAKADRLARHLEAGSVFVNALVKSDARLPFGGVKHSGYGRELSSFGIREFVNIKTIYHAKTAQAVDVQQRDDVVQQGVSE